MIIPGFAMKRVFSLLAMLAVLASCGINDLNEPPVPLGEFRLGHNVVVASKMQMVPISRPATEEDWVTALQKAIEERFGRYEGDQLYHLGVSVEGFALAPPGVPIVATPKSVLAINVTVWDDAAAAKLNEKVRQLVVFENDPGNLVVGSGLSNTREEQIENLARSAAKSIERWLVEQNREEGWFEPRPQAAQSASETANPTPETTSTEE